MVRMIAYHSTKAKNRLSIQRHGLLARRTAEHNYPCCPKQPVGVYALCAGEDLYRWGISEYDVRNTVVFEVDLLGVPLQRDDLVPGAVVAARNIEPDRLRLLSSDADILDNMVAYTV